MGGAGPPLSSLLTRVDSKCRKITVEEASMKFEKMKELGMHDNKL